MEVALSIPFLESMTLFSLIYDRYEKHLKNELWLCHKNMNLTMDEIYNMPINDRKFYIRLHNKSIEEMKNKMNTKGAK